MKTYAAVLCGINLGAYTTEGQASRSNRFNPRRKPNTTWTEDFPRPESCSGCSEGRQTLYWQTHLISHSCGYPNVVYTAEVYFITLITS